MFMYIKYHMQTEKWVAASLSASNVGEHSGTGDQTVPRADILRTDRQSGLEVRRHCVYFWAHAHAGRRLRVRWGGMTDCRNDGFRSGIGRSIHHSGMAQAPATPFWRPGWKGCS